jgi:hypothetical protein
LKATHLLLFYFYFSGCFPSNVLLYREYKTVLCDYYIPFFNSVKTWLHPMSVYSFLRSVKMPP